MISHPASPTPFGVPLFVDYAMVSATVFSARGIRAEDVSLLGDRSSDPYAIIDVRLHLLAEKRKMECTILTRLHFLTIDINFEP